MYVKLSKEVEGYNGVNVHDDRQQHDREKQLFAVVRDRLQNRTKLFDVDTNVEQVCGEEEVVVVSQD